MSGRSSRRAFHHAKLVTVLFLALLAPRAGAGADCAGDLDGNGTVSIDEIIRIVNAAMDGCPGGGGAAGIGCPGDLSGDGIVTIDEIILAIVSAMNGCPPSPTPTISPTIASPPPPVTPSPTATPPPSETPPPTAAPTTCPFTFADNMSSFCEYSGTFNTDATCPSGLGALLLSTGEFIVAGLETDPPLTLAANVTSATSATLQFYTVDNDSAHPITITGTMELQDGGRTLSISLDAPILFWIGSPTCTIERYDGTFTGVVAF